jgi:hypothetical protein
MKSGFLFLLKPQSIFELLYTPQHEITMHSNWI